MSSSSSLSVSFRPRAGATWISCLALASALTMTACGEEATGPQVTQDRYVPPTSTKAERRLTPFRDVPSAASGLHFQHVTGAFDTPQGPSRYLPETMGPGVVLFDPDADGDLDLFVANGSSFPGRDEGSGASGRLFRNDGDLSFSDVTVEAGLERPFYGMGGAAADLDGDGDQELLQTGWGGLRLWTNQLREEGSLRFEESTAQAGLSTPQWTDAQGHSGPDWSVSAAFFDMDADGDLDLFVANYVRWCPDNDVFDSLDGETKSYAIPKRYEGHTNRVFENTFAQSGELRFREVTEAAGVLSSDAKAMGLVTWDFDGDGQLDVLVSNDTQPNQLYLWRGPMRFEEVALQHGIAFDESGQVRAGMGIDVIADHASNASCVAIGNFSREPAALYLDRAGGQANGPDFSDVGQAAGVAAATHLPLTFGLVWTDVDRDGLRDLVLANGHIEPFVQKTQASIAYAQRPTLIRQSRPGRFFDGTALGGESFARASVARGLAAGDLDLDGDEDLVLGTVGGGLRLLRNDTVPIGGSRTVRLVGKAPNTDAIGTRLELHFQKGPPLVESVRTGGSYASQSSLERLLSWPLEQQPTHLLVRWPSGEERTISAAEWPIQGTHPLVITQDS